jgi:two-component system, sensor histidine kinase RegB
MQRPMPAPLPPFTGERIRLRTLVLIRWMALAGQLLAISLADRHYGFDLPLEQCTMVIGIATLVNVYATFQFPETRRLTEAEALLSLLFDLIHLSFLLYLTGGLTNPFALFLLGPVVISAAALSPRTTVFMALMAVCFTTLLTIDNLPMHFDDGTTFTLPPVFEFGFWLSIMAGTLFLGFYAYRVGAEMRSMGQALAATQLALAREQKLTDLGGVIAATAHELGTPLATIKLVSGELMHALKDRPELHSDAVLIRDQADRCRDILRSMGRAGKDDQQLRRAPVLAVVQEAAEPHMNRGRQVLIAGAPSGPDEALQPVILRRPEIVHGLRNLVQNAVDFARDQVRIDVAWSEETVAVAIADDGRGFPVQLLGRIGEPYLRGARDQPGEGRGREGMGLGLFIAKTLLERTGARLTFENGPADTAPGATVTVAWAREDLDLGPERGLGANPVITS